MRHFLSLVTAMLYMPICFAGMNLFTQIKCMKNMERITSENEHFHLMINQKLDVLIKYSWSSQTERKVTQLLKEQSEDKKHRKSDVENLSEKIDKIMLRDLVDENSPRNFIKIARIVKNLFSTSELEEIKKDKSNIFLALINKAENQSASTQGVKTLVGDIERLKLKYLDILSLGDHPPHLRFSKMITELESGNILNPIVFEGIKDIIEMPSILLSYLYKEMLRKAYQNYLTAENKERLYKYTQRDFLKKFASVEYLDFLNLLVSYMNYPGQRLFQVENVGQKIEINFSYLQKIYTDYFVEKETIFSNSDIAYISASAVQRYHILVEKYKLYAKKMIELLIKNEEVVVKNIVVQSSQFDFSISKKAYLFKNSLTEAQLNEETIIMNEYNLDTYLVSSRFILDSALTYFTDEAQLILDAYMRLTPQLNLIENDGQNKMFLPPYEAIFCTSALKTSQYFFSTSGPVKEEISQKEKIHLKRRQKDLKLKRLIHKEEVQLLKEIDDTVKHLQRKDEFRFKLNSRLADIFNDMFKLDKLHETLHANAISNVYGLLKYLIENKKINDEINFSKHHHHLLSLDPAIVNRSIRNVIESDQYIKDNRIRTFLNGVNKGLYSLKATIRKQIELLFRQTLERAKKDISNGILIQKQNALSLTDEERSKLYSPVSLAHLLEIYFPGKLLFLLMQYSTENNNRVLKINPIIEKVLGITGSENQKLADLLNRRGFNVHQIPDDEYLSFDIYERIAGEKNKLYKIKKALPAIARKGLGIKSLKPRYHRIRQWFRFPPKVMSSFSNEETQNHKYFINFIKDVLFPNQPFYMNQSLVKFAKIMELDSHDFVSTFQGNMPLSKELALELFNQFPHRQDEFVNFTFDGEKIFEEMISAKSQTLHQKVIGDYLDIIINGGNSLSLENEFYRKELIEQMKLQNISVKELVAKVDIPPLSIRQILYGERPITPKDLFLVRTIGLDIPKDIPSDLSRKIEMIRDYNLNSLQQGATQLKRFKVRELFQKYTDSVSMINIDVISKIISELVNQQVFLKIEEYQELISKLNELGIDVNLKSEYLRKIFLEVQLPLDRDFQNYIFENKLDIQQIKTLEILLFKQYLEGGVSLSKLLEDYKL